MSATTVEADRLSVVTHAAYEIEALLSMLGREYEAENDQYKFGLILRTTLRRMDDLNGVIMSVAGGDDSRTTEDMQRVVRGEA